jgi:acyl-CoA synthetase (AMP-forming)/AMP-acid ligase II
MSSFKTHLTILETSASKHPSTAAFKLPRLDPRTGRVQEWTTITYRQYLQDVELFAKYWAHTLQGLNIPQRSVVGVWYVWTILTLHELDAQTFRLGGTTYVDALHVYGISRAGYIPQLFSLRLPSPSVIFELIRKADARALIYDASFESVLKDCPVPTLLASDARDAGDISGPVPALPPVVSGDDTVLLLHTSGSTSGMPKLVPWSYAWMNNAIDKLSQYQRVSKLGGQMVNTWVGSVCHAGQNLRM